MAINAVVELPMTEKKPFMLQAQGMRPSLPEANLLSPEGKGIPMGIASGAMIKLHESILSHKGNPERMFSNHRSAVRKIKPVMPIMRTGQNMCFDLTGLTLPAIKLPIPE